MPPKCGHGLLPKGGQYLSKCGQTLSKCGQYSHAPTPNMYIPLVSEEGAGLDLLSPIRLTLGGGKGGLRACKGRYIREGSSEDVSNRVCVCVCCLC